MIDSLGSQMALLGHLVLEFLKIGKSATTEALLVPVAEIGVESHDIDGIVLSALLQCCLDILQINIVTEFGLVGSVQNAFGRDKTFLLEEAVLLDETPEEGLGHVQ